MKPDELPVPEAPLVPEVPVAPPEELLGLPVLLALPELLAPNEPPEAAWASSVTSGIVVVCPLLTNTF